MTSMCPNFNRLTAKAAGCVTASWGSNWESIIEDFSYQEVSLLLVRLTFHSLALFFGLADFEPCMQKCKFSREKSTEPHSHEVT